MGSWSELDGNTPPGALIVTGGSRGIGAAVSLLAGARGYAVAVNYARDARAADAVVKQIIAAGGRAVAIQADVAQEADVLRLFSEAEAALGRIGGLVNNAGIVTQTTRLVDLTGEALAQVMAVNVNGTILCAREAVRRMSIALGGAGGAIVNVSSLAARIGGAGDWVHYAASKGAVESFSVGLAREVAAEGIRVNVVAPGLIDTEIHASGGMPDRATRLAHTVPMGRFGTAQETAEAIIWLLSPAASYVTGAKIEVGGGR
jgi:NAD(P)-dependent dehydrogenase (short-subunit alcohol dehydrogenase family)